MGKIGDLFVKLGLKKDDFSKGMAEAKKETNSFKVISAAALGGAINMWGKIGKAAMDAAISFIKSSQKFGDVWDKTMNQMGSAWSTFMQSLLSWDWDNFGNKMKNAMRAAGDAAELRDQYGDYSNSVRMRKAAMKDELAVLEIQMRNQQLSYDQRAKAAQEYLDKVKPLYEEEARFRKKLMYSEMDVFLQGAGVSRQHGRYEDLIDFFKNVAPNPDAVNEIKNNLGTMGKIAQGYLNSSDEEHKAIVDVYEAYFNAEAAYNEETRKIQSILNSAAGHASTAQETAPELKTNRAVELMKDTEYQLQEFESALSKIATDISDDYGMMEVEIDTSGLDSFVEAYLDMVHRAEDITQEFREAVVGGFSDGMQTMMEGLMGAEEFNGGAVVQALLTPLADMAIKEGEILMASGLGLEALQKALMNPMTGGIAAIGAGAALIAIGSAAKAGLAALAKSGSTSSAGTASTYSGASASSSSIQTELTIHLEGKLSGSDIILAGQRTMSQWNR